MWRPACQRSGSPFSRSTYCVKYATLLHGFTRASRLTSWQFRHEPSCLMWARSSPVLPCIRFRPNRNNAPTPQPPAFPVAQGRHHILQRRPIRSLQARPSSILQTNFSHTDFRPLFHLALDAPPGDEPGSPEAMLAEQHDPQAEAHTATTVSKKLEPVQAI
jgi:hypothetical protein